MSLAIIGQILAGFASPVAVNRILAYVVFRPTILLCLICD